MSHRYMTLTGRIPEAVGKSTSLHRHFHPIPTKGITFIGCDYSAIEARCIFQRLNSKYSGVANWCKTLKKLLTESKMKTLKKQQYEKIMAMMMDFSPTNVQTVRTSCGESNFSEETKQLGPLTRSVGVDAPSAQYIKEWASPTGEFASPGPYSPGPYMFTFYGDPWGVRALVSFFWDNDRTGSVGYKPRTMVQWLSTVRPEWSQTTVRELKPDEVFGDPNPRLIWQEEFQNPGISPAVKYSVVMNLPGTSDWTRKGHWYLNMNNNSVFEVLGVSDIYDESWEILSHKGERSHNDHLCEDVFGSYKGIVRIQPKPKPENLDDGFVLTGKLVNTLGEPVPGKTWAKGPADATSAKHPPYLWETTEVKKPKSRKGQVLVSVDKFDLINRITGEPQWDSKHGTWRHPYDTWSEGKWVSADSGWSESFITEDR